MKEEEIGSLKGDYSKKNRGERKEGVEVWELKVFFLRMGKISTCL